MELVPSNVPLTFEVTYDSPSLFVAMNVWDNTTGTPVLTGLPTPMTNVNGTNSYIARFTPTDQHSYVLVKTVYTDGTYETPNTDYAAGSESIFATTIGGGGGGSTASVTSVIGVVNNPQYIYYPDGRMPVFTMFIGDDNQLPLMVLLANLVPLDLTECSAITVFIPNQDGSFLELTLGDGVEITDPTVLGQIVATWTSDQSALFMVQELQTINVAFTINGIVRTVAFPNCFSVFQGNG